MTEYTIRDALLDFRKEQEKMRDCWQDEIAKRYQSVLSTYDARFAELDKMLMNASEEMERLKLFCRRVEEEEAQFERVLYRGRVRNEYLGEA